MTIQTDTSHRQVRYGMCHSLLRAVDWMYDWSTVSSYATEQTQSGGSPLYKVLEQQQDYRTITQRYFVPTRLVKFIRTAGLKRIVNDQDDGC